MDSLAVGQKIDGGIDERVVLFVKLPEGYNLSADFEEKIKTEIRARRSPRHVPARVRALLCLLSDCQCRTIYRSYKSRISLIP